MFKLGAAVDMIERIYLAMFYQKILLRYIVNVKVKLTSSKSEFCSPEDERKFEISLEHAFLFVGKVRVNPGVLLEYSNSLKKQQLNILLTKCSVKHIPSQMEVCFLHKAIFYRSKSALDICRLCG